jgi:hypothetical protein
VADDLLAIRVEHRAVEDGDVANRPSPAAEVDDLEDLLLGIGDEIEVLRNVVIVATSGDEQKRRGDRCRGESTG